MAIGETFPAEWIEYSDPETQRPRIQFTTARANSYPLYYFIPSFTADGRHLIFHSERSDMAQLYRLDRHTGEIAQLTDGHTRDSGWALWCAYHLRGIFNHLSALNPARSEVYYFQDDEIRCTHVESFANRVVFQMPGRIPIGQSSFSPEGRHFAFIHADESAFRQALADREALTNMGQFDWAVGHEVWRNAIPCAIGTLDTATGAYRDVVTLDFHVHHVLWLDNQTLLINHTRNHNGMWIVNLDGTGIRALRPLDEHGTICHQIIARDCILYEANSNQPRDGKNAVWFGRYDLARDTFEEVALPNVGYVHTGNDPLGRFLFIENQDAVHELLSVHFPRQPHKLHLRRLCKLNASLRGQRYHAHPFLSPDRQWVFFADVVRGFSQVCSIRVGDLVELNEYWDAQER